jgi:hypothetical protein
MTIMENVHELEGHDDLVERVLSTLSPEQRLAGLSVAERLAGLSVAERLAGLSPEEVLRHFEPEQIASYLCAWAEANGGLPPAVIDMLREYMDRTP